MANNDDIKIRKMRPEAWELLETMPGAGGGSATPKAKPKSKSAYVLAKEPRSTEKGDRPKKPAVQTKGDEALVEKIFETAERHRDPTDLYSAEPTDPVFTYGPDYGKALTKELVEQRSVRGDLPPMPSAEKLPLKGRSLPILENSDAIANLLAKDLSQLPADYKPKAFYSTGPVLAGLIDRAGLSPDAATSFMRDWSGQGAATSPRTSTPQNLRNASYLMYRRAQGDPLTAEKQTAEQEAGLWGHGPVKNKDTGLVEMRNNLNRPGFAMMQMHTGLGDEFAKGTVNPWNNPKPYTFRENWSGNVQDVTSDTHAIRATLDALDRLFPGGVPRGFFEKQADFDAYQAAGGFPKEGQLPGIKDTLAKQVIPGTGKQAQTEYPVLTSPIYGAADKLGWDPAETQAAMWFLYGDRTGLESPQLTIPDLLNRQIEATAKATGIAPERILKLWTTGRIPLAEADVSDVPGATATG